MEVVKKKDISRRDFLRAITGIGIGAIAGGAVSAPASALVNNTVGNVTGQPTGNAFNADKVKQKCKNDPNFNECKEEYVHTETNIINSTVIAPITEEFGYRAVPSFFLDLADNDIDSTKPVPKTTLFGKESYKLTRKELIYGLASSAIFAYTHNMYTKQNSNGGDSLVFNTGTIPAAQFTTGMMIWYLTRKFGIGSAVAAHSAHNAVVIIGA